MARQLGYEGLNFDVTQIACKNDALLVVSRAYFLRSECGRLGVLAFRGTEPADLISWLADANSIRTPFPFGGGRARIHEGFYANTEVIWEDIVKVLGAAAKNEVQKDPACPVIPPVDKPYANAMESLLITGHSLGAAMAVIAAACLVFGPDAESSRDRMLRGVYTFGQPMVGDEDFVSMCGARFGDRLFRHVFDDDVVPRVPPATVPGFAHFGQRLYSPGIATPWRAMPATDRALTMTGALTSVALSFVMRRMFFGPVVERFVPLSYSLDDHSPASYTHVSRLTVSMLREKGGVAM
jgi:hypothetical protein